MLLSLLLRRLDGDAHHSNESCCPPQSLLVTKELWPRFSPDKIMGWADLEQVLASHLDCVTRAAIRLANLELTVHMNIHPVVSCSQSNQDDFFFFFFFAFPSYTSGVHHFLGEIFAYVTVF